MTDAPQPNRADDQRIRKNMNTHQWMTLDNEDWSCLVCDCKDWHVAAGYPCGQEPPRVDTDLWCDPSKVSCYLATGHNGPHAQNPKLRIPLGKVPFETDGTGIQDDAYDWDEPDPHEWGRTP